MYYYMCLNLLPTQICHLSSVYINSKAFLVWFVMLTSLQCFDIVGVKEKYKLCAHHIRKLPYIETQ